MAAVPSSSPDYEGLRAAIRAWLAANFPGCPFQWATIHALNLPIDLNIVERPGTPAWMPPPPLAATHPIEEGRDKKSGLDETTKAILHVLRKSKKPLTKTMMLEALEEAQRKDEIDDHCSISESTVCRRLKELMEDGTLSNPDDARPRGYRFSE